MAKKARRVGLAFMAHPDDAELLCGGALIRLAEAGWELHIATVTPGDCGTTTETPWAIGATRTAEARKAASLIGATYHCLDERDGFIVYDKSTVRKAMDLFRIVAPTLVFTNALHDYMVDHEMTALVCRSASFLHGAPNVSTFPLLAGTIIPHLYYCDPLEGRDALGIEVRPTIVIDISEQIKRKARMLACHASQRAWLRAHHGMDEYLEGMKRHAALRGKQVGCPFAEAFVQHLGHAYPQDDLLAELFGNAAG